MIVERGICLGIIIICSLYGYTYGSGEQCTTGWFYRHCYDNYKFVNGHLTFFDKCCKMNGTWYCVANTAYHKCEERGFTTTAVPPTTTRSPRYSTTTAYWNTWWRTTTAYWNPWLRTTTASWNRWWTTTSRPSHYGSNTVSNSHSSVAIPVGVTVGVISIIAIIFLVACFTFVKKKRNSQPHQNGQVIHTHATGNMPVPRGNPVYYTPGSTAGHAFDYHQHLGSHQVISRAEIGMPPSYDTIIANNRTNLDTDNIGSIKQYENYTAENIPDHPPPQYLELPVDSSHSTHVNLAQQTEDSLS